MLFINNMQIQDLVAYQHIQNSINHISDDLPFILGLANHERIYFITNICL
jgi:hypothetical protein